MVSRPNDVDSSMLFSPPPGLVLLRDLTLSADHCAAVWSVEGETVVICYDLRKGAPAHGRRVRLSHLDRFRDLREEDSALLNDLAHSPEETVTVEMLRRVFRAFRFPLAAIVQALEQDLPFSLQRKVMGTPQLCEEMFGFVVESCRGWAELLHAQIPSLTRSTSLLLAYDSLIAACQRRTQAIFTLQRGCLEYRPDRSCLQVVGAGEVPSLLDLGEAERLEGATDPVASVIVTVGKSLLSRTAFRVQMCFVKGGIGLDEVKDVLGLAFQVLDAEQRRHLREVAVRLPRMEATIEELELAPFPRPLNGEAIACSRRLFDANTDLEIAAELTRDHYRKKTEQLVAAALMLTSLEEDFSPHSTLREAVITDFLPRVRTARRR